jgi:hypothetical protein
MMIIKVTLRKIEKIQINLVRRNKRIVRVKRREMS